MSTPAEQPSSLTFRITPISLLAVIALAVCVTPVAWAQQWLLLLYLVPLALLVWIFRVRTVVDTERIKARGVLRTKRIAWDDVKSFRLHERRWLRVVLSDDAEVLLPAVRVRDLPHLAAMSGGRLPDPNAERADDDASADADDATDDSAGTDTPADGVPADQHPAEAEADADAQG